jgi:5'-3' exonuclease
MGVKGLWKALAPAGRRIDITTLHGKVLAIDASIWLVQFVKAMREPDGSMQRNAHLLGTFRRVCKLLANRIRPVFVFDGAAPVLKRRTLLLRAEKRASGEERQNRAERRLLLLALERDRQAREHGAVGAAAPPAPPPPAFSAVTVVGGGGGGGGGGSGDGGAAPAGAGAALDATTEEEVEGEEDAMLLRRAIAMSKGEDAVGGGGGAVPASGRRRRRLRPLRDRAPRAAPSGVGDGGAASGGDEGEGAEFVDEGGGEDEEEEEEEGGFVAAPRAHAPRAPAAAPFLVGGRPVATYVSSDEEGGAPALGALVLPSRTADVDVSALASLPPSMQRDFAEELQRMRRRESRAVLAGAGGDPGAFSRSQLALYLQTAELNRKMERANEAGAAAFLAGSRIAGEAGREFVLLEEKPDGTSGPVGRAGLLKPSVEDDGLVPRGSTRAGAAGVGAAPADGGAAAAPPAPPPPLPLEGSAEEARARLFSLAGVLGADAPAYAALGASGARVALESGEARAAALLRARRARGRGGGARGGRGGARAREGLSHAAHKGVRALLADLGVDASGPISRALSDMPGGVGLSMELGGGAGARARGVAAAGGAGGEAAREAAGGGAGEDSEDWDVEGPSAAAGEAGGQVEDFWGDGDAAAGGEDFAYCPGAADGDQVDEELEVNNLRRIEAADGEEGAQVPSAGGRGEDVRAACVAGGGEEEWEDAPPAEGRDELEDAPPPAVRVVFEAYTGTGDAAAALEARVAALRRAREAAAMGSSAEGEWGEEGSARAPTAAAKGEEQTATTAAAPPSPGRSENPSTRGGTDDEEEREAMAAVALEAEEERKRFAAALARQRDGGGSTGGEAGGESGDDEDLRCAIERSRFECGGGAAAAAPAHVVGGGGSTVISLSDGEGGGGGGGGGGGSNFESVVAVSASPPRASAAPAAASTDDDVVPVAPAARARAPAAAAQRGAAPLRAPLSIAPAVLRAEEVAARAAAASGAREQAGVTPDMVSDVMVLLECFGVPYLCAPMEAEAQCAALEAAGAVDGVVTDDSDALLFGARRVYRNLFDARKHVEAYRMEDVEKELGLRRDDLVSLALLLGSDYTGGVKGVGIVNAMEVLRAFPGPGGLKRFGEWARGGDGGGGGGEDDDEAAAAVAHFAKRHPGAREKWLVPATFPSRAVVEAYAAPRVAPLPRGRAGLSWAPPDGPRLAALCGAKFGWAEKEVAAAVSPVLSAAAARGGGGGGPVQRTLGDWVVQYDDGVRGGKIKSKRLLEAVAGRLGVAASDRSDPRLADIVLVEEEEEEGGGGGGGRAEKLARRGGAAAAKEGSDVEVVDAGSSEEGGGCVDVVEVGSSEEGGGAAAAAAPLRGRGRGRGGARAGRGASGRMGGAVSGAKKRKRKARGGVSEERGGSPVELGFSSGEAGGSGEEGADAEQPPPRRRGVGRRRGKARKRAITAADFESLDEAEGEE